MSKKVKKVKKLFDEYGNFLGKLPLACIYNCTHKGECVDDIREWVKKLNFIVPENLARKYLQGFGAWDDLEFCDQNILSERVLWIACCYFKESGEWFGLVD
jgi:hypothetical protein